MPWLTKNKAQIKSSKKVSKSYHHKVLHAAPVKPQRAFKLIRSLLLSNTPQHIQSFLLTLEKASVLFPLWANPSFCTKTRAHRKGSHNEDCVVFFLILFFPYQLQEKPRPRSSSTNSFLSIKPKISNNH